MTYRKSFSALSNSVESEIEDATLNGKIVLDRQLNDRARLTNNLANIDVRGVSETLGSFTYTLSESYQRTDPVGFDDDSVSYSRTDRFDVEGGLVAVLYRELNVDEGEVLSLNYFLNGEEISSNLYYRILQDLDRQIGLERYN